MQTQYINNSFLNRYYRHRSAIIITIIEILAIAIIAAIIGPKIEFTINGVVIWLGYLLVNTTNIIIAIIIGILVLGDLRSWIGTIRTLGLTSILRWRQVYSLSGRSISSSHKSVWIMVARELIVLGVLLALWIATRFETILWILALRFLLLVHEPIDTGRPPAVLLLGASDNEVVHTQSEIEKSVRWNRVVSLLYLPPFAKSFTAEIHDWDILRVPDKDNWERMVDDLIDIIPIVVVDCRVLTEFVVYELMIMLNIERMHKLIIIADDKGKKRVLAGMPWIPRRLFFNKEQALERLHNMTNSPESLPKPTKFFL
ncbi:MAG: hypothetical protein H6974_10300 [Gammaproteobacteria bacterium]|nr:hypothetical protein [Gammaproteobacteria bacterium]